MAKKPKKPPRLKFGCRPDGTPAVSEIKITEYTSVESTPIPDHLQAAIEQKLRDRGLIPGDKPKDE
jgi:hypothetical protein